MSSLQTSLPATTDRQKAGIIEVNEQSPLEQARQERATSRFKVPIMKLRNLKSEVEIPVGDYFTFEEDEDGERIPVSLGPNPAVKIIAHYYCYSEYSPSENKIVLCTNELKNFDSAQRVILYEYGDNQNTILFEGNYPEFKGFKTSDRQYSQLKFRHVMYVLHNDKVYKLIVSNASYAGVPEGEKSGDYRKPQEGSFLHFEKCLVGDAGEPLALFEHDVELGSLEHLDNETPDYLLMTFKDKGRITPEETKQLEQVWLEVTRALALKERSDFESACTQSE